MKTYHKGLYGASASITDRVDGTAKLIVRIYNGKKTRDSVHKNRQAALVAWRRMNY